MGRSSSNSIVGVNQTSTANGVCASGVDSVHLAVEVRSEEAPVDRDHLAVETVQGAEAEVAVLGELRKLHVTVIGAIEQGTDRRGLKELMGPTLGVELLGPERLHVQGPDQTLVEHGSKSRIRDRPATPARVRSPAGGC